MTRVEAIRKRHTQGAAVKRVGIYHSTADQFVYYCPYCKQEWPCDAIQACDAYDALREDRERLAGELGKVNEERSNLHIRLLEICEDCANGVGIHGETHCEPTDSEGPSNHRPCKLRKLQSRLASAEQRVREVYCGCNCHDLCKVPEANCVEHTNHKECWEAVCKECDDENEKLYLEIATREVREASLREALRGLQNVIHDYAPRISHQACLRFDVKDSERTCINTGSDLCELCKAQQALGEG